MCNFDQTEGYLTDTITNTNSNPNTATNTTTIPCYGMRHYTIADLFAERQRGRTAARLATRRSGASIYCSSSSCSCFLFKYGAV